jgi:hypothetical protein
MLRLALEELGMGKERVDVCRGEGRRVLMARRTYCVRYGMETLGLCIQKEVGDVVVENERC